jgi:hypothetical protein
MRCPQRWRDTRRAAVVVDKSLTIGEGMSETQMSALSA